MIFPSPYSTAIATLCPGEFAIPVLPWIISPVGLALTNLRPFKAMFTLVQSRGFQHVTTAYLPHISTAAGLQPRDINTLEAGLHADISAAITGWRLRSPLSPTDAELSKIAIGIQLWGGITGRHPFIRNGEFGNNFSVTAYRNMIDLLLSPPPAAVGMPYPALGKAVGLWQGKSFNYFGVSFATKHLSFWSKAAGMPTLLPIYDNIIADNFMGYFKINKSGNRIGVPHWDHYWIYVNQMRAAVANINASNPHFGGAYTITQLERQLFTWTATPAAASWVR